MSTATITKFKNSTPVIQNFEGFMDADDELLEIAKYIKTTTQHNEYIEPEKVKFLYSSKPKKEGGRYVISDLIKRSEMEKMIDDTYDFILTVFYDVWKDLDGEQKVVLLDKALCGIDMGSMEKQKLGKKTPDSREYINNLMYFGPEKVLKISEIVDLACNRVLEEKKEKAKNKQTDDIDETIKGEKDGQ